MQNDKNLIKKALNNTIDFMYQIEPKCICEQCPYGYKSDKTSRAQCAIKRDQTKKEHIQWERRLLKWKDKLKNAE